MAVQFDTHLKKPLQEICVQNDLLEVKVCHDSLTALCAIIQSLLGDTNREKNGDVTGGASGSENGSLCHEMGEMLRQDLGVRFKFMMFHKRIC